MSGWREDWQAEGLGFGDHALVVGDRPAELTRDACGRGEMDRVERPCVVPPICAAAGTIGSIASNRNPASTPTATAGACPPRRRAVRVISTVARKLEARSGQLRSSRRSAAVSASIAISLTRAEESRYATGVLLARLTHVARLWAAFNLECRRCRRVRAEIERIDLEQIALCAVNAPLRIPNTGGVRLVPSSSTRGLAFSRADHLAAAGVRYRQRDGRRDGRCSDACDLQTPG